MRMLYYLSENQNHLSVSAIFTIINKTFLIKSNDFSTG